jgi:uncharacterized protein (TIGR03067 family)
VLRWRVLVRGRKSIMRRVIPILLVAWLLLVLACGGLKSKMTTDSSTTTTTTKDGNAGTNSPNPSGDPAAAELAKFQGTWVPVEGEMLENKADPRMLRSLKWTFASNKLTTTDGQKATFTLNTSANPKTIDIKADSLPKDAAGFGVVAETYGIYEWNGDMLKICIGNGQRPTSFSTKGVKFGAYYVMKRN